MTINITYSNKFSPTGRRLRDALGARKVRVDGPPWRPRRTRSAPFLIVWGGGMDRQVPNNTRMVRNGTPFNKLGQLQRLRESLGENCPEFTTDIRVAEEWRQRGKVLARQRLDGHSGQGIEEFTGQHAPLFVRYYPKDVELRVHVFDNEVILLTQKRRRNGFDGNPIIRNHANGYIYSANLSNWLDLGTIQQLAVRAVQTLGYRWGGVDIICRKERNPRYLVLEVNACPGLEGRSVNAYAEKFRQLYTSRAV